MWRAPLSFVFCRENRSFLTKKLAEGCSFAEGRCSGGSLTGTDVGSARTPLFGTTDKRKRPWQNAKASSMCGLDFPVFEVVCSGEELAFREPALCSSNLAGDNPVQKGSCPQGPVLAGVSLFLLPSGFLLFDYIIPQCPAILQEGSGLFVAS